MPFLALAAGVLAGHFVFTSIREGIGPTIAAGLLASICWSVPKARRFRLPSLLLFCALAGLMAQILHRHDHRPTLSVADGDLALLEGCVTDPPVFSGAGPDGRAQFTVHLSRRSAVRASAMLKYGPLPAIPYGTRVQIAAKVRPPHNFRDPGEFDYEGWLAAQQIYWTASISSPADITVLPGGCGHAAMRPVYTVRDWALGRLDRLYPNDPQTGTLLKAILLGQTAGMERRWTSDFRLTGTYHALVISGQHVAVLAACLLVLLRFTRLGRMPSLFATACVCWGYALVTGMSAPVVRAAGAFTLYLIARYLFRRVRVLNILAALGFVYLILDPDALFDASFQLSFLSAAALAAFALPLMERWTEPLRVASRTIDRTAVHPNQNARIATVRVEMRLFAETLAVWLKCPLPVATVAVSLMGKCLSYVVETILVSACVQLGLALPMIAYFHRLSITGLSANVVIIPLLSLVVPLGFGAIATHSGLLAGITAACLHWAQVVAAWHRMLEPSWRIATVPFEVAILFAASLALFAWSLRRQRHRILSGAMCLVVFGVICFQPWKPKLRAGWLEVSAIDVSQGDSLFVAFPDGRTMLVDAGGFPGIGNMQRTPNLDMGEDVVSPYLWSRQIQRLDYVVLTHGHSDHMQGLCAVLTNYHPRELWTGPEPESAQWREARKCATASGTAIKQLSSDAPIREFGKARVRVLSPAPQYAAGEAAGNNDSLVLLVEMGKRSALLTGDAERAAEDAILENCNLPGVTLLKVGHHGSKTSSSDEFLDALKPQFAFISAGYLNQFHHPHRDVLQRLEDRHAMVLRTDRNGLSMFLTDGDRVEVSSYWP